MQSRFCHEAAQNALLHRILQTTIKIASVVHLEYLHGDVLGPRIVGEALGLHPVVSILAVVTGAELFGINGALFVGPLTGVALAIVKALWASWQTLNPHEFTLDPAAKAASALAAE